MMQEFSIGGRVSDDGLQIVLDEPPLYRVNVRRLKPGQRVTVRVKAETPQRTLNQNAYWWAVPVKLLAEHCGYTDSQMHYALLGECYGYTKGPTGKAVPVKPSSSELTVDEFQHLIDWVLTWAPTELGVIIPEPHEYDIGRTA